MLSVYLSQFLHHHPQVLRRSQEDSYRRSTDVGLMIRSGVLMGLSISAMCSCVMEGQTVLMEMMRKIVPLKQPVHMHLDISFTTNCVGHLLKYACFRN
jgi:hypothetical protein